MSQRKFIKLTADQKWDYVGAMLTKPKGVFNHLVDPKVFNSSFSRNVGEGRFLGWPQLGLAYAEGYKGLRRAQKAIKETSNQVEALIDEIDNFLEFIEAAEQDGDMSLYDAKHIIDDLDFVNLIDELHDDSVERRSSQQLNRREL